MNFYDSSFQVYIRYMGECPQTCAEVNESVSAWVENGYKEFMLCLARVSTICFLIDTANKPTRPINS